MANTTTCKDFLFGINGKKEYSTLRMAPLIDMIFLLLIFFLVAAKWRPQENFLPLQLPIYQTSAVNRVKPTAFSITLEPNQSGFSVRLLDQKIIVSEQNLETDLAAFVDEFQQLLVRQKRNLHDPVRIYCHEKLKWDYVAKVYNLLYRLGLSDITLMMTENAYNGQNN